MYSNCYICHFKFVLLALFLNLIHVTQKISKDKHIFPHVKNEKKYYQPKITIHSYLILLKCRFTGSNPVT